MICEICKRDKPGLNWVSGTSGAYLVCGDCAEPLRAEIQVMIARLDACDTSDALLRELLSAALHVTAGDMGNVQLADEHNVLRIRAQSGFGPEFLRFFNGVQENEAACGTAVAKRRTVMVTDVDESPIFAGTEVLGILHRADLRSVQSTPMFARSGALVGVVSTYFRQPHTFGYHELDLVGHLAAHAATVLERLVPVSHESNL